jgi:Fe-S-cluster-containing dehydrogenase component
VVLFLVQVHRLPVLHAGCPFELDLRVPQRWTPKVSKCTMCYDHIQAGKRQVPGCVEACRRRR